MQISNSGSLRTINELQKNGRKLNQSLANLASGKKSLAQDPAGAAIASRLDSQVRGLSQAFDNASSAQNSLAVAAGGLNSISNDLARLKEKVLQKGNPLSSEDQAIVNEELAATVDQISQTANSTEFDGQNLLNNGDSTEFAVGEDGSTVSVEGQSVTSSDLGLEGIENMSTEDALAAIEAAERQVASAAGSFGAAQNRLDSTQANLQVQVENISSARSRIEDVDVAVETAKVTALKIKQELGTAVAAQANLVNADSLRLFG